MKLITLVLSLAFSISAMSEESQDKTKFLYLQFNHELVIGISGLDCPNEKLRKQYPWAATVKNTTDRNAMVGCYGPISPNDLRIVWQNGTVNEFPANVFLLPQDRFKEEVPKQPQIPENKISI